MGFEPPNRLMKDPDCCLDEPTELDSGLLEASPARNMTALSTIRRPRNPLKVKSDGSQSWTLGTFCLLQLVV